VLRPVRVSDAVQMSYAGTHPPVVREFASDFEANECWGYNRFFRIDLLVRCAGRSRASLPPTRDRVSA
jgi:hypothetical protein